MIRAPASMTCLRSRSIASMVTLLLCLPWARPVQAREAQTASSELEALRQRVSKLEAELENLRRDYGERLAALERRLTEKDTAATATTETTAPTAADAGARPRPSDERAGGREEERAELERELAAILGEQKEAATSGRVAAPQETTSSGEQRFTGRERLLTGLNPEISVTGDMFGTVADSPESDKFELSEFELAFQSPLDPYSLAKAFVVQEEGSFGVEEAFIDWTALPGGIGLKVGQFRHDWGKLNRWHNHALPQAERPLAHQALLGEEGLGGLGVSFSWLPPNFLGDYNELWVQVTNDENETAFSGRGFDDPIILLHETNYWDLSSSTYVEVGVSAATGVNDPLGRYRTHLLGVDWNFDWRPPAQALYKGLELRGELLWQRREDAADVVHSWGGYTYANYKVNRRWYVGLRADWTELPLEPGADIWGVSPYVEWWQSEWARLRFQYRHSSRRLEEAQSENRLFFQVTWALGPHKHEKY